MKPTRKHNIKRKCIRTYKQIKQSGGVYKSLKESFVNATIENLDTTNPCKNFEINSNTPIKKDGIYPAKCNQDENYVIKKNVNTKEVLIHIELSKHGITLPISKIIHAGRNNYHIIMPKYKDTLEDRLQNIKLSKTQIDKINIHIQTYKNSLPSDIQQIITNRQNTYMQKYDLSTYKTLMDWNKYIEHIFNGVISSSRTVVKDLQIDLEDGQRIFYINTLKSAVKLIHKMHQLGFIHGDAHPGNFMFDKRDKIYVIDFGRTYKIEECEDLRTNVSSRKLKIDTDLFTPINITALRERLLKEKCHNKNIFFNNDFIWDLPENIKTTILKPNYVDDIAPFVGNITRTTCSGTNQ